MTRTSVIVMTLVALLGATANAQEPAAELLGWQAVAATLPPGAFVEIWLKDGRTLRGTVLGHGVETLLVKPRTRVPMPNMEVALRDIDSLRKPGMSTGKKVGIGVIIVVASFFAAVAILNASGNLGN